MKYAAIAWVLALSAIMLGSATDTRASEPMPDLAVQTSLQSELARLKGNLASGGRATKVFDKHAVRKAPGKAGAKERAAFGRYRSFMQRSAASMRKLLARGRVLLKRVAREQGIIIADMQALNGDFVQLKKSVESESHTLSSGSDALGESHKEVVGSMSGIR